MTITVTAPNGVTINFPDGTDSATIDGAMRQALGAAAPAAEATTGGLIKAAGIGAAQGAIGLAGLPGDAAEWIGRGTAYVAKKINPNAPDFDPSKDNILPTSADIKKKVEGYTGEFYEPKNTAEKYARTIGEFGIGAVGGPGSLLARTARQVVLPGVMSEAAGQFTEGTKAEPFARVAGALAAPLATAAARRAVTPFPVAPNNSQLSRHVRELEAEGITLTAGQRTGSRGLQWAESNAADVPGASHPARQVFDGQGEQFTAAVMRRAGETTNRATPENVDRMFTRIGQQFDDLAARNWLEVDRPFVLDVQRIWRDYTSLVPPNSRAPIVADMIQDIRSIQQQNQGVMPGAAYQVLRSRLDAAARASRNDPQLSGALMGLRNALDEVAERTISLRNPNDLGAWRQARREYRNALVIRRAATSAGADNGGLITPAALKQATMQVHGRENYGRGRSGDFDRLAHAGVAIMKQLPNSGTAPRANINMGMTAAGGIAGALFGGAPGTAIGMAAAAAAPAVGSRLLMSNLGQRYLSNQRAATQPTAAELRNARLLLLGPAAAQAGI